MLTIENNQKTVRIACSGRPLLRYQADTVASKPHFDFVALPPAADPRPGENIVLAAPHDQPWYLGLFFSPRILDGLDFWESERLAELGQRYGDCRAAGPVTTQVRDDGAVALSHDLRWRTSDDETWLTEHRDIIVQPPSDNAYRIDWAITLTAVGKDRVWGVSGKEGACAGLTYRSLRSMEGDAGQVLSSEGGDTLDAVHARQARWCDYTGLLDGRIGAGAPDRAGVTLMDHPSNPGHPRTWYASTRPGLIAANPASGAEWTLHQDQSVSLRFAVLVHAGAADRDRIETEYGHFATPA